MRPDYYTHPYVSNSCLSKLKRELSGEDQRDPTEAFRMGTLYGSIITEPDRVDMLKMTIDDYSYNEKEIQHAKLFRQTFMNDPLCKSFFDRSKTEYEFFVDDVHFDGPVPFKLNIRCRYDGFIPVVNWGWELKSTSASTQSAFESAIDKFDYDRAAYWYMKCSGSDRIAIIGIGKSNMKVFKVFITEGDRLWSQGKEKADDLAYKKWMIG